MIVYDLEGNDHDMPSVDARECANEMGWSFTAPGKQVTSLESDIPADQFSEMTNAELKGNLDSRNIPYPTNCNKSALLALCRS